MLCFLFPKGWEILATGQETDKFMGCLRDQVKHRAVGTRMRGQGEAARVLTNSANPVGTPGTSVVPRVCPSLGHNAVVECDQFMERSHFGPDGILPWDSTDHRLYS